MNLTLKKGALLISALFFGLQNPVRATEQAACVPPGPLSWHAVEYVYDGDTLKTASGLKVRLIGVNAPETQKPDHPAEPLADRAHVYLQDRIAAAGNRIGLLPGIEKEDRYGRHLAHVYLPDGENLNAALIAEGLGTLIAVPPNVRLHDCYRQAENQARPAKAGLWADENRHILQAGDLTSRDTGFRVVHGKVTRIGNSRYAVWLNMGEHLALRIHRADLEWFSGLDLQQLKGKVLEVRGWVTAKKGRLRMSLRHPAAIRIVD